MGASYSSRSRTVEAVSARYIAPDDGRARQLTLSTTRVLRRSRFNSRWRSRLGSMNLLAPSYQHENWRKLRHHVKVANSRRRCGPDLYSRLSSRVGTNERARNYSIQLRFGQFGPRFILPAFLESGPSLSSRLPRESALMKEQRFTRSSYRFGPRFIVPASSRVCSTWVVPASDGCPMERKKGGTRVVARFGWLSGGT